MRHAGLAGAVHAVHDQDGRLEQLRALWPELADRIGRDQLIDW